MNRIEKGLHEHHARLQAQAQDGPATATLLPSASNSTAAALEAPFAKVNSVVDGSPADSAGLKAGDTITKFGWVDWTNHDKLARVAEAVSQNEGVSCPHCGPLPLHGIFTKPSRCTASHRRARQVAWTYANKTTASNHRKSSATKYVWRPFGTCRGAAHP